MSLLKRARNLAQSRLASLEISERNNLYGSLESTSHQRSTATTHDEANKKPSTPPKKVIHPRGGQFGFSGIRAASSTFTLGVSFASCTFAIS